ncbi:TetR/AcrR family transcriptional regulator [Rhodococcus qingshengii]|jgi:AcrR family transcriptional regulator|uniref:TetR family transcriptional regulator n=7 Tax=Actinomycetes TaxID=1760 RepID=A0A0C3AC18_RHOER|nr:MULTISPECIES: TetR/AcrR family transcriptional regulator [Rhodococcus]EEN88239.1 transcriptional regulator, TetR family [Rhodococcus erythropolis SK121]MCD2156628.1 TetR/AcrR family transcriptional regulator [Rhodococcus cerastii]NHE68147.1 TetR/AcrR family transcriptional regulator [Rhodococcus sp. D-46]NHP15804.1 TetR/AcrR family transcriptional regulator [Rhodococcus sp. IC4_135]OCC18659.1 TetR family transcriptional regulator [Prescottella equi]
MTSEQVAAPTRRDQMKADRRRQLLDAAARLIAERGFVSVRLEDLGAAVGISGPAVYRHFPNKDAVLVELLVGISTRLHEGGSAAAEAADSPSAALDALVEFHLDFALGEPDLIRIQDRDLESLPADARRQVRQTQRKYVEVWVGVLEQLDPQLDQADARIKAHATFGLINSTPHSANPASPARARRVLRDMTLAALRTH